MVDNVKATLESEPICELPIDPVVEPAPSIDTFSGNEPDDIEYVTVCSCSEAAFL